MGELPQFSRALPRTVESNAFEERSPIGNHAALDERPGSVHKASRIRPGAGEETAIGLTVLAIIRVASPGMPLYESPFLKAASPRANSF